jgi:3-phenylpropionate/trans-cinnamate dioxygenase ferredoxin subunit
MEFVRVGALAEVPEGEVRAFELPARRVAVAHVDHHLYAVADECTHAGCSVSEGEVSESEPAVRCPCHESLFDLENGEPLDGPAVDPLAVHAVRVEDGWIEVASEPGIQP